MILLKCPSRMSTLGEFFTVHVSCLPVKVSLEPAIFPSFSLSPWKKQTKITKLHAANVTSPRVNCHREALHLPSVFSSSTGTTTQKQVFQNW